MSSRTIFLITGTNRGIGFSLTSSLLSRPNTTVIATVRSSNSDTKELLSLPTGQGSNLVIGTLSNTSDADAASLVSTLIVEHGITHIDTVISNAGSGTTFQSVLATCIDQIRESFEINSLGPIKLFQAMLPLLQKAKEPKFILVSSSLGSIGGMEGEVPSLAYGIGKVGANYLVRKVHFEHKDMTALAVHPGWVKTANGQNFANAVGVEEPPMKLENSVRGVLEQIDAASRSTTSGSFVSYDSTLIPW